jgi:HlyD family secretion protein
MPTTSTKTVSPPAPPAGGDVAAIAEILGDPTATAPLQRSRPWRFPWALVATLAVAAATAAAAAPRAREWLRRSSSAPTTKLLSHTVEPGDLLVAVTEDGSLVSDENVDIVCRVAGGGTIVWLVDDGANVSKGDELVVLDSSKLAEDVTAQKIAYEKARAANIQAEKDYAAATIAVEEYTEGTFKKDLRKAESDVTFAKERLQATRNTLEHGERMFRKGYISPQQLDAQKSAVARAELDLGTMEIALDVLQRFGRPKMVTELASKRDAAEAKRDSERAALELEKAKLERLTAQLEKCRIRAPKDGLVIYANERRDRDSEIKNGAKVNEGSTILRLPDLSRMRVDVEVHESRVDKIRVGMPARIRVQEREFTGQVSAVANRPQYNWMSSAKKYVVQVRIDGEPADLRPGFTAEVEIRIAELHDVLAVPVAAVVEQGGGYYCGVREGDAVVRRQVTTGQSNEKFIEITSGLSPGDVVVLAPRAAIGDLDATPEAPAQAPAPAIPPAPPRAAAATGG